MKIEEALLTPNPYSRPQIPLEHVTRIIIHWVGNPNTSAKNNRNYFESLKTKKVYASAHYIIGLKGEILRCVPENEVAYHAKEANNYSIGIENCHPDSQGKFNDLTYEALIELCAYLCKRYKLNPKKALFRHYDITGKLCPKYYVENIAAWEKLKQDVSNKLELSKEDEKLSLSVKLLIEKGIQIDINIWGNMKTMNLKYAKTLVERIGKFYNQPTYEKTIDFLVQKRCIQSRQPWDEGRFHVEWCRQLLINVSHTFV